MPAQERPVDRGTRRARAALELLSRELRAARSDRGLSLRAVGRSIGLSESATSRLERGLVPNASVLALIRFAEVVGLELSVRTYPGGRPLRDVAHVRLLGEFRGGLHRSIGWATEVPLPGRGEQRAWDALIRGEGWLYGVEAETSPRDGQALARRLATKLRDGAVDGVLLVVPDTRRVRTFLREADIELAGAFPVAGRRASELLRAGVDPGGSAVIVVPRAVRGGAARSVGGRGNVRSSGS